MSKVLGMLVALALFGAMPAVAAAQGTSPSGGGNTTSSGNTQTGDIDQDANAGSGGNAGNQACLIQQNAGRDANAACNQTQNFNAQRSVTSGARSTGVTSRGVTSGVTSRGVTSGVTSGGVGGGGVQAVTLAATGFDAWVLALIGGVSAAGGLGLLAAQRRGRLSA
jgi:hypothetical protein